MASKPLKMAIIEILNKSSNLTIDEIMSELKNDYGTERQFNKKNFSNLIHALKAVGIFERSGFFVDSQNEIQEQYSLSETGKKSLRFIKN